LMQWLCIGLPMKLNRGKGYFRIDIVRLDGQRAIQDGFFFGIASETLGTQGNLLQQVNAPWVEIERALKVSCSVFRASLTPLDVTLQLENAGLIWQGFASNLQLS